MTGARERMMTAVRDGLLRADLPDASSEHPVYRPASATAPPGLDDLCESFSRALVALTGSVHRAGSADAVADIVTAIAHTHAADAYLSWDADGIPCPGLIGLLASRGLRRVTYDLPVEPQARDAGVQTLAPISIGLTGADAALADCGGLVLASGPGRGRLVSLLPLVHVAVVREDRLFPSLSALLGMHPEWLDLGSNLAVIAGPSRTADIEMTLTHGVHGPRHVHAILVR